MEQEKKDYDLLDVLQGMWRGVVTLMQWLGYVLKGACKSVLRHKWAAVLTVVLFGGLGVAYVFKYDKVCLFDTDSEMRVYATDAYFVAEQLKYLDNLCSTGRYEEAAKLTGLDVETVKCIKGIDSYFVLFSELDQTLTVVDYEDRYLNDTTIKRDDKYLHVHVLVSHLKHLKELPAGIETYLRGSEYVQSRLALETKKLEDFRQYYAKEYAALDSLRDMEYFDQARNGQRERLEGGVLVKDNTHQLYHEDVMKLKASEMDCIERLKVIDQVAVFQHDLCVRKVKYPIVITPLMFAMVGLMLMLAFFAYFDNRKELLKAIND